MRSLKKIILGEALATYLKMCMFSDDLTCPSVGMTGAP